MVSFFDRINFFLTGLTGLTGLLRCLNHVNHVNPVCFFFCKSCLFLIFSDFVEQYPNIGVL